ncbi:MAG: hypothetical protein OXG40_03700 [Acidimicrobiaceae bacterium]|nr:hypothetical protein [Acidimicrobiaceae bacterium]MDE0515990.1 hypothetical protein [Acidimicrobiaceae bacterium]MDE0655221.1 hypothetical protein [Acidimicrobiaceae bacterium]
MRIYAPVGAVGPAAISRAVAGPTLAGKRIGILDNSKPNAGLLLRRLAEGLAARTGATVGLVERKNAALPAPDDLLARLAEAEVVLTGSAD